MASGATDVKCWIADTDVRRHRRQGPPRDFSLWELTTLLMTAISGGHIHSRTLHTSTAAMGLENPRPDRPPPAPNGAHSPPLAAVEVCNVRLKTHTLTLNRCGL